MRLLRKVHRYLYRGSVGFFFGIFYPFLYLNSYKKINYTALNRLRRMLGLCSSATAGIFYRYHFEEAITWDQPYIVCPNHTSSLDITAVTLLVNQNISFLGKDDLLKNPVTGLFFRTIDIPLNRDSKMSSFRAFKRAEEHLKSGISLVIFPEGKIGDLYPPILNQFKNGPFRLAIEQNIAILPVTMPNNWKMMWDDGAEYGSKPGICDIWVHKPVITNNMAVHEDEKLKKLVFEMIQKKLDEYEAGQPNN